MEKIKIDINCDVGEGMDNEQELLPLISSCNIACGGHAGNLATMEKVIQLAMRHKVKIGAHPSYPDTGNFGRVSMDIPSGQLQKSIEKQIDALIKVVHEQKARLHHIKAHGALYNDIAKNRRIADLFLKTIEKYRESVFVYVPYNSIIEALALKKGFRIKREAFGDRAYNDDLSLVSRKLTTKALITEPKKVLEQIVSIVKEEKVKTIQGKKAPILAETLCIHGDTPTALQILTYLSKELPKLNMSIKK